MKRQKLTRRTQKSNFSRDFEFEKCNSSYQTQQPDLPIVPSRDAMANPSSKNTDIALFVCDDPYVKTIISDFYRAIPVSSHNRLNSNSRLRFSLNLIRHLEKLYSY